MFPISGLVFGFSNLLHRAAQMNRGCARTLFCLPRNRRRQRVIDFERCRPISELLQQTLVCWAKTLARDLQELSRGDIAESDFEISERIYIDYPLRSLYHSAELLQIADQGVRNGLRSASRYRPADSVRGDSKHQTDSRGHRFVECEK